MLYTGLCLIQLDGSILVRCLQVGTNNYILLTFFLLVLTLIYLTFRENFT